MDLGSGAGFPGLPLAIQHPTLRVTLVEARRRRHHFQRSAIRTLGLGNAVPRLGRAEGLVPELASAVVAQAVARPAQVLGWMARWAAPGALLVIPAGSKPTPFEAPEGVVPLGWHPYRVPLGGPQRTAWLGRLGSG